MFFFSFFFFKQKTAYEMRISDWSSDVCSSDLLTCKSGLFRGGGLGIADPPDHTTHVITDQQCPGIVYQHIHRTAPSFIFLGQKAGKQINGRSEEHTSELQSLMRISYAVFCLKKKKETTGKEW